jgi:hypothetical protein
MHELISFVMICNNINNKHRVSRINVHLYLRSLLFGKDSKTAANRREKVDTI